MDRPKFSMSCPKYQYSIQIGLSLSSHTDVNVINNYLEASLLTPKEDKLYKSKE